LFVSLGLVLLTSERTNTATKRQQAMAQAYYEATHSKNGICLGKAINFQFWELH